MKVGLFVLAVVMLGAVAFAMRDTGSPPADTAREACVLAQDAVRRTQEHPTAGEPALPAELRRVTFGPSEDCSATSDDNGATWRVSGFVRGLSAYAQCPRDRCPELETVLRYQGRYAGAMPGSRR